VRENLLKKFPAMKTDELSTKDKRNDLIIQKNLVPNVVAVNRRELIDFDK